MPPKNPYGNGNNYGRPAQPGLPPQPQRQFRPMGRPMNRPMRPRPTMPTAGQLRALPKTLMQPQHRRQLVATAVGVVVIIGGITLLVNRGSNPDELFQLAMTNMLSTKSYTQQSVSGTDTITIKADVSDIKQSQIRGEFDLRSAKTNISGYATNKQSLIRFNAYGIPLNGVDITSIKGKWVRLTANGQASDGASDGLGFANLFSPPSAILGRFTFANVPTTSRYSLVESIKNTGVYSYNPKKVQAADVNGQPAQLYVVTIKNNALKNLNQRIASLASITQEQADTVLDGKVGDADVVMNVFIGTASQRILKVETTTGTKSVTTFTDYDTTRLGAAPAVEVQSPSVLRR